MRRRPHVADAVAAVATTAVAMVALLLPVTSQHVILRHSDGGPGDFRSVAEATQASVAAVVTGGEDNAAEEGRDLTRPDPTVDGSSQEEEEEEEEEEEDDVRSQVQFPRHAIVSDDFDGGRDDDDDDDDDDVGGGGGDDDDDVNDYYEDDDDDDDDDDGDHDDDDGDEDGNLEGRLSSRSAMTESDASFEPVGGGDVDAEGKHGVDACDGGSHVTVNVIDDDDNNVSISSSNNNNNNNKADDIGKTDRLPGNAGNSVNRSNDEQPGDDDDDVDEEEATTNQKAPISSSSSSPLTSPPTHPSGRAAEKPERRLPQAIIIGVKKGGTRALLEFLQLHPRVKAPGPEVHFFDKNYALGLEWYRQQMPLTTSDQLTIEKTPSYFVTRDAPRRVRAMSPGVRLIIVVRDPVTRAISDYAQAKSKKTDLASFEELVFRRSPAAAATSPTSPTARAATAAVSTSWGAVRIGLYAKHLDRWLAHFPKERIHFVHGERLVVDPAGEMALLQDFLGLDRYITDRFFYFDRIKGFPCLRVRPNSSYTWPSERSTSTFVAEAAGAVAGVGAESGPDPPMMPSGEKAAILPGSSSSSSSSSAADASLPFSPSNTFEHLRPSSSAAASSSSPSSPWIDASSAGGRFETHHCLGKTKGRMHPDIPRSTVERLRQFYRPYNERFYRMTGVNFGWS